MHIQIKQKVLCYRLSSRFSVESSIKRFRSVCISPRNVTTGQSVLTFHRSCCHLTYDPWPYVALASDWSDRLCVDLCGQLGRPPGKEEGEEEWKEREWRGDWHWQTVDATFPFSSTNKLKFRLLVYLLIRFGWTFSFCCRSNKNHAHVCICAVVKYLKNAR